MKSCIYEIQIEHYFYIGKDMNSRRQREHLNLLMRGTHYNTFMQNVYNKHKSFKFSVIEEFSEISKSELSQKEIDYIAKYREEKGFSFVMNLTDGGEGGSGHIKSPRQIEWATTFMTEQNPTRKIERDSVLDIYRMIKEGKTNTEIGAIFNLHSGYISQIRIGDKYQDLFQEHFSTPIVSPGRQKISYDIFLKIVSLHKEGLNYQRISEKTGVDRSSINRICLRQTYKTYWKRYDKCA